MIRTKIIATMGPACGDVETLLQLFKAGVGVCRLNFSHGSLDNHLLMLRRIREAAARWDTPIAVLGDLCGPKIRLGQVKDVGGTGGMPIGIGDELIIQRAPVVGENGRVSCIYAGLVDDVRVGDRVLIEDGLLRFVCTDKNYNEIRCACTAGGVLKSSKGINLPNTPVSIPSITDKDWECCDWAIENDLDYLALSFVRSADDLNLLRQHLKNRASDMHLVAKIEKAEAISEIEAIIEASDALMVARGDLGVEMDLARVPLIQKDLVSRCQIAGKPVIVATQMLQSMIEQSSPTRAEVSDVANAILDGTDAVMLSGETSVGKYPLGAVHIMAHVAEVTEHETAMTRPLRDVQLRLKTHPLSASVARGVRDIVEELKPALVAVYSQTGATARIFSKYRFNVPIVAFSVNHRVLRRMALHYGVVPQELSAPANMTELTAQVDKILQQRGYAKPGDRVVIVAGASLGTPGTLNSIVVHTLGNGWLAEAPLDRVSLSSILPVPASNGEPAVDGLDPWQNHTA
jgi:pyruvate kinase